MRTRIVVLGLDAADLAVMRPLVERGEMPNIGRLLAEGASGVLHSTVPPVSAPAWASFLTGRHPGSHGLYSFVVERAGGRMQLANVTDIHGPKLWEVAAAQGVRPVVANVPVTWPPPEIEGVLVSGMLTPESQSVVYTHPPELMKAIEERVPGYRIDIDRALLEDHEHLYAELSEMERRRRDLFLELLRTEAWGLFVGIFTNTDRVQHSYWRHDRRLVDEHFKEIDAHVGAIMAELDLANTVVMLMSDHGFQDCRFKVYLNRVLQDRGLLATRRTEAIDEDYDRRRPDFFLGFQGGRGELHEAGRGARWRGVLATAGVAGHVAIDWLHTRAFMWSLDTGGVAVNLRSRYPHGIVEDRDYETVRGEIVDVLGHVRAPDGRRAFRTVRRREDVYRGEFVTGAPDVIAEPDDAVAFGIQLDAKEALRAHKRPEGHHSPRGFVCLAGAGIRKGARIEGHVVDCMPTILHALGLAVPHGCEGHVLEDAFVERRPVQSTPDPAPAAAPARPAASYTADEEAHLRRSLEGLGYL